MVLSVKIKFSRHAKRRAKLYGIPESAITDILADTNLHQGEQAVIKNMTGFPYPLKIIVTVEEGTATVITNYPLKKGVKK